MEYKTLKLSELKPYENNPRIIDGAIPDVVESINQCGYITPIIVDENNVILAGHTRYEALKKLNVEECNIIVVSGLSDSKKKKYRLYDNKSAELAKWDPQKLIQEVGNLDFGGYDFGQPKFEPFKYEKQKEKIICPCCGEEFEV